MSVVVASFYQFVPLTELAVLRSHLQSFCRDRQLLGTILLAPEGINATLAGSQTAIDALLDELRQHPAFRNLDRLEYKAAIAETPPFQRLKVRLKPEIVSFGNPDGKPDANLCDRVGTYVPPEQWNQLVDDPSVTLIDTRNDFEVAIGSFEGAQNPKTASFREFADYVERELDPDTTPNVALFCTGGIRCEKATAYLRDRGFNAVYHLKGGILRYLETVPEADSRWRGECFVFDDRVSVRHGLQPGTHEICLSCGDPVSPEAKASPQYEFGVSCPRCCDRLTDEKRRRQRAKVRQMQSSARTNARTNAKPNALVPASDRQPRESN